MKPEHYHAFTEQLQQMLDSYDDVIGFIAMGSMAGTDRQPDEQSDHDFFVITKSGQQQGYRDSTDWLPDSEQVVLHFQETEHGCKVVYENGHLLEYAIFDRDELLMARINSYRILIDKADLSAMMPSLQVTASAEFDSQRAFDTMICNLLVGSMRATRGEIMSAHAFIRLYALNTFMRLCWHELSTDSPHRDSLDPFRRFEQQFPDIGRELESVLEQPIQKTALALLALAERHLAPLLPDKREEAIQTIRRNILSRQKG